MGTISKWLRPRRDVDTSRDRDVETQTTTQHVALGRLFLHVNYPTFSHRLYISTEFPWGQLRGFGTPISPCHGVPRHCPFHYVCFLCTVDSAIVLYHSTTSGYYLMIKDRSHGRRSKVIDTRVQIVQFEVRTQKYYRVSIIFINRNAIVIHEIFAVMYLYTVFQKKNIHSYYWL